MQRLTLLLALLLISPGCAGVGITNRLLWETHKDYEVELLAYSPGRDGPGQAQFRLTSEDGEVRTHTVDVDWWPAAEQRAGGPSLDPPLRTRPDVALSPPFSCGPPMLMQIGEDTRAPRIRRVEVHDGIGWREQATLPAWTEPPSGWRRLLYAVLLPVAIGVDVATAPLQIGLFALLLALF